MTAKLSGFEILHSGSLALVQDLGRYGFQHCGITEGGPLDLQAFCWANRLLDNPIGAAQIEISMGQFRLKSRVTTQVSLCGADLSASLNQYPLVPWQSFPVKPGDILDFWGPSSGLRAYLAVKGGFVLPPKMGSQSTVVREGLGGINGDKLASGQYLPCLPGRNTIRRMVPEKYIPDTSLPLTLRYFPAYQHGLFSTTELDKLHQGQYKVSAHCDRMGYRLTGPSIDSGLTGIISEGLGFGAIQIPADGAPIVLLRDRQTIGGYPKIGTVCMFDAWQLAQRPANSDVSFTPVSVANLRPQYIRFQRFFNLPL